MSPSCFVTTRFLLFHAALYPFAPNPSRPTTRLTASYEELEASGYFRGLEEGNLPAANERGDDMSTVVDTGYASYARFIRPPHHRNRGSCISSVTFMGEPHPEAETETETEPESEAEAAGVGYAVDVRGVGITSALVSSALGAPAPAPAPSPAAPATPPPTAGRSSSLQAMLDQSSQVLLRGGARHPAGPMERQDGQGGADLAAVAAASAAESWAEAWAEEEDEWIGRLAAADRTQSNSSLRLCSDSTQSIPGGGGNGHGHASLSRAGSMSHSRPGSLSHSGGGSLSRALGGSFSRSLGGSFSHSRAGSLLHLRTGSLSHSRGGSGSGSLSHAMGVSLVQTLGGSLPHSRAGSLSHSRAGSLSHSRGVSLSAAETGRGDSFAGGYLPVAPELVSTEDKEVGRYAVRVREVLTVYPSH